MLVQQPVYKLVDFSTSHSNYLVAYELEGETPRTYLLEVGQPECVPHFP